MSKGKLLLLAVIAALPLVPSGGAFAQTVSSQEELLRRLEQAEERIRILERKLELSQEEAAGKARDAATGKPSARAWMVSKTVLMPTASAPRTPTIRTSAGAASSTICRSATPSRVRSRALIPIRKTGWSSTTTIRTTSPALTAAPSPPWSPTRRWPR